MTDTDLPNVPGAPTTMEDAIAQYIATARELDALPNERRYHGATATILSSRKEMLQEYIEHFAKQRIPSDTGKHRIELGHGIVLHVYDDVSIEHADLYDVDLFPWAEQHAPEAIRMYLNGDDVRAAISKMPPQDRPSWATSKHSTYLDIPHNIGKE